MGRNKKKFTLWIYPDTLEKVEKNYKDDDCRSKSEFIEKAILFYTGYLTEADYLAYFSNVIVSTMKGNLDSLENRMASFFMAVELSMMLLMLLRQTMILMKTRFSACVVCVLKK